MHNYEQSKMSTTCTELRLKPMRLKRQLALTDTLAATGIDKKPLLRGFHGCRVSIEPSYSIEWKRVWKGNGNGEREDVL